MNTDQPLVKANNIYLQFGSKTVLSDVDLTVYPNEIVTLIGPNGAGKSTLVRTVLGLIEPDSGSIQIKPGIRIGYMPQKLHVESFMPLSVHRFLSLGLETEAEVKSLPEVMDELFISKIQTQPIQSISGGELQRVLLARALLKKPQLLVLDEPVQGVDINGQAALYRFILNIRDRIGCGILMVSHDLHLVMSGTDSVVCLNQHVCCKGSPEIVSQHPEFLNLFGLQKPFAFYNHNHNHRHDMDGELCP